MLSTEILNAWADPGRNGCGHNLWTQRSPFRSRRNMAGATQTAYRPN